MGSMGSGSTTPGSPAQWLSAASSPRHAPPDLHLAHEEYESRQAGNALSRTAGQSVALAGPTGRPRSRHGYLRGEGRAGVGRSWIRSTIAQRLMYSGTLNWAGPADRWADGGGAGDGLRCAHWRAPRRSSRARWIGGGASRHRESPRVLDARCAVGTIGSPRTGGLGEATEWRSRRGPPTSVCDEFLVPALISHLHPGPRR
jgi:hypothetical protein